MPELDEDRAAPVLFGRYRVLELLGEGAHGLVYAAADPDTNAHVALKVLRAGVARSADLKREFRLVADLTHPNLVLPYALETDGEQVFFTMELVRGESVIAWLDRQSAADRPATLRSLARQLCEGLGTIHQRGLVHRDIKPSNILVEPNGRVAILDFGLVRQVEAPDGDTARYFAGSPGGLAPELFRGALASAASDAYAVGVLLHLALTGSYPFSADVRKSIDARLTRASAPPVDVDPTDVAEVCRGLLDPNPATRMRVDEVIAKITSAPVTSMRAPAPGIVFERDAELAELMHAHERVALDRRPMTAHVPGQSGMGKTALLRSFARSLRTKAWVLEGRAYERDTVPFKALDAAMDQLAHRLASISAAERARILPSEPEALHVLFPALARALAIPVPAPVADADPVVRRTWGARGLAELLAAVASHFGLVLILDDLQWGDRDSALLLTELLAPPSPPILVVLAYRAEPTALPFLELCKRYEDEARTVTVPVGPLTFEGAVRMAETLSMGDVAVDDAARERALAIARESGGCPFIVEMLVSAPHGETLSFERALANRIATLSAPARRMLEAVCVAARPVARGQVPFAPAHSNDARAAWAMLIGSRLLRSDGTDAGDAIEVYHDRIRDTITRAIGEGERRSTHLALGESFAPSDAESAATHFAAAGEKARAFQFARVAAEGAMVALAFDRGAQLLALALDCCPEDALGLRRELLLGRARALANCGRSAEAAPLFLECAAGATALEGLNLRREAMEQYLVIGRIDEGRPVMEALLRDLGVWQPRAAWLTNAALYAEVARLLLRGPIVKKTRELAPDERLLLDTFGSIGKGFASYDATLGAWFFLRAARRALDWGDPKHAARGIAYTATLLGFSGATSDIKRAESWLAAGESLAATHSDGHGSAFCQVGRGMIECCSGQWEKAIATFDAAAALLDASYAASMWESDTAKNTSLFALNQTGNLRELEARSQVLTRDARARGDIALEVESNLHLALVALGQDDAAEALRGIARNLGLWTVSGYHFQHWIALRLRTLARLYEGSCDVALAQMDEELPQAKKANLTSMQLVRIDAADFHGRAALGVAARMTGKLQAKALSRVRADVKALVGEERPHARAPAEMLRGGMATIAGQPADARKHFRDAAVAYDGAAMKTHALTAHWLVAVIDDDPSAVEGIEDALRERGVRVAARWARMQLGMDIR